MGCSYPSPDYNIIRCKILYRSSHVHQRQWAALSGNEDCKGINTAEIVRKETIFSLAFDQRNQHVKLPATLLSHSHKIVDEKRRIC